MIYVFTCSTTDCIYNKEPVRMIDPTSPVLCGACFCYSVPVATDELASTPE